MGEDLKLWLSLVSFIAARGLPLHRFGSADTCRWWRLEQSAQALSSARLRYREGPTCVSIASAGSPAIVGCIATSMSPISGASHPTTRSHQRPKTVLAHQAKQPGLLQIEQPVTAKHSLQAMRVLQEHNAQTPPPAAQKKPARRRRSLLDSPASSVSAGCPETLFRLPCLVLGSIHLPCVPQAASPSPQTARRGR